MKTYLRIVLMACLFAGTAGFAQSQSNGDTSKTNHKQALFLFNHYPRFYNPSNTVSFATLADRHMIKPIVFKPDYSYQAYSFLDYTPRVNSFNFPYMNRPDFVNHYNTINPYGATNPLDVVVTGSLDYLLWKLFDDK